jgi:Protein of unknown function (DUF3551)
VRTVISALLLCCTTSTMGAVPAAAREYPFCIKGCDFGGSGIGDCSFTSYQQCQATASGRVATCAANPYFSAHDELQPNLIHHSRRRY